MERLGANEALAVEVIDRLVVAGVRTFCVCPGGRNAPLVEAIERLVARPRFDVLSFFEERVASFFALGRARRDARPVAVVTTSGTAAAELLPAMVEAYYSGAQLVAVTADRPAAYRGTGAPQSIEQVRLFGTYARKFFDLGQAGTDWALDREGPSHINVCFDEPLLAGWQRAEPRHVETTSPERRMVSTADDSQLAEVGAFLQSVRAPLVIVGSLHTPGDSEAVAAFCRAFGAPVLAEAAASVADALDGLALRSGDAAAKRGFERGTFDSVLRIGEIPSFRIWRDLDLTLKVPVLSLSRTPWRGLTHGTHLHVERDRPLPLPDAVSGLGTNAAALLAWDGRIHAATEQLATAFPDSEPGIVRRLSRLIPDGAFVYLGNSQPIREWTQFAVSGERGWTIGESRGANGIDGQVSTFLGCARTDVENWAVLGDLTALYDLPSLWAIRHLPDVRARVVVINNGGGRIFERMFANERFQNRHETTFAAWAALWNVAYVDGLDAWLSCADANGPGDAVSIIEIRPSDEQTAAFHAALAAEISR